MEENSLQVNTVPDLTSQICAGGSKKTKGSFGTVYQCTMKDSEGTKEVAVKEIIIDSNRDLAKIEKDMLRELQVWLMLNPSTIVPLLGTACRVDSPLLALVSEWMPFGTLKEYLEMHATTLNSSDRIELAKGLAAGVHELRSKSVVHGDLHPGNVLIDSEGKPRLTDFGLATVVGDPDLQWGTTTAARPLNAQWRAPEVIGIENEPAKPTFESDIYSLGSVIFFIFSEHAPWENKNFSQISIELSRKATPTRPKDVTNHHWNLIQKCWSRNPDHRPTPKEVFENIDQFGNDDSQPSISNQPVDLTGQINGDVKDFAGGGAFTNVYKCECKELTGTIQVAVKVIRFDIPGDALKNFLRETKTWADLEHDRIVRLLGTANEFGSSLAPALVFPWFHTTLRRLIDKQDASLSIGSKLRLLLDTASGLEYLHGRGIVHGDITSSNVLVDKQEGEYRACLTDVGLATVLGGRSAEWVMQVTSARLDAPWWTDPELRDGNPRKEHDIYSFGCVMYHVLAQVPWHTIHIRRDITGATLCPATSDSPDITKARREQIKKCWLAVRSRLSASDAIEFLNSELNSARPTPPDPLNVLLFGDVRVGSSSVIDLIVTGDAAQIEETCTLRHISREVSVGGQRFKLWEASSIKSMGFFRTFFLKRGLKQSCKELYGDKGICLLLCCMRGSSTPKTLVKDYNFFTDIVGSTVGPDRLPIAIVVNHDDWLQQNQENLTRLNMPFYKDACIISLPDDHQNTPELRRKAEDALCKLICDFYQPRPVS